jgi:hypothetical protein
MCTTRLRASWTRQVSAGSAGVTSRWMSAAPSTTGSRLPPARRRPAARSDQRGGLRHPPTAGSDPRRGRRDRQPPLPLHPHAASAPRLGRRRSIRGEQQAPPLRRSLPPGWRSRANDHRRRGWAMGTRDGVASGASRSEADTRDPDGDIRGASATITRDAPAVGCIGQMRRHRAGDRRVWPRAWRRDEPLILCPPV